ncbi:histidine phosphatase family protein [Alkalihalobacillus pseudalcaliphilus]|uniref:histidine phosphatase family protein n=1 Tax=Alkalihalobacillus pseudalcaliphilus TaxID=79884 RepID=UPI00064DEA0B|nr:histidine phosphatase family protein [Alkalihalobacillus pseudalcaliphilus]KMK75242.1 hypothetical protein AB990_17590 [Alkalihalobacillus pseudalcaliphilus]
MLHLYITRHGETEWNTQNKMQGWGDSALTEKGINEAKALAQRLNDVEFDLIYTSPSGRTLETAHILNTFHELPIMKNEHLKEINVGSWEGKTFAWIEEHYPVEFNAFFHKPLQFESIGGESFQQLKERVHTFMEDLKLKHQQGNILIVTHAVVIKMLLIYFKERTLAELWNPPFIEGTSLTQIQMNTATTKIILEGNTEHLLTIGHQKGD